MKNLAEITKKDGTYDQFFLLYKYNNVYYTPYTMILGTDNWPVANAAEIIPHFSGTADSFYSRTKIAHTKRNRPDDSDRYGDKDYISIFTKYNGIGESGDYNNVAPLSA